MDELLASVSEIDFASLDLLPYGIVVLDADGYVVFYNRREEEIADRNRADVLGRNFFTEVAPCTEVSEFQGRFREAVGSEGLTVEFSFHFPFVDRPRDVEIAMTGFRIDERTLCLVSVRDVTESERVRDVIMSSKRFAQVGEVASGVAHNFNNTLMGVSTWVAVLQREAGDLSPRAARALEEIARSIADGKKMIARIADRRAEPQLDQPSEIDVNDVVLEALSSARSRHLHLHPEQTPAVEVNLGERMPRVRAFGSELREVVVNLVVNAFDAVRQRGGVKISTSSTATDVKIVIADSGTGMAESVRAKLFRPYFTTKGEAGTGMGLSTSFALIRRVGGSISVSSSEESGSTFTVTLPAV